MADGTLRIGELARRSGVSADLLRAWERRYALLEPARTPSGYRLYSADDEARVRSMRAHLAQGLSAAEAARLARNAPAAARHDGVPADLAAALWSALDGFDDAGAQAAFDRLVAAFSIETVAATAVLPYLRTLGERWRNGDASVAQEHFATGVLRARLLGLARGWDRGTGPRALLACPSGERHDLGLIILGLALRERGWRVTFLGSRHADRDDRSRGRSTRARRGRGLLADARAAPCGRDRDRPDGRLAARTAGRRRRRRRARRAIEGSTARRGPIEAAEEVSVQRKRALHHPPRSSG